MWSVCGFERMVVRSLRFAFGGDEVYCIWLFVPMYLLFLLQYLSFPIGIGFMRFSAVTHPNTHTHSQFTAMKEAEKNLEKQCKHGHILVQHKFRTILQIC